MIKLLETIFLLVLIAVPVMATSSETPSEFFSDYVQFLIDGRYAEAANHWSEGTVLRSRRLNIEYKGIDFKYDCTSPIIGNERFLQGGGAEYFIDSTKQDRNYFIVYYSILNKTNSNKIGGVYYIKTSFGRLKLITPAEYYARDWDLIVTNYCNLYFADSSLINKTAIEALDRFIDSTLDFLNVNDARKSELRLNKIDYYLCQKNQFVAITGYDAHGIFDIPSDAIISRHLPHRHELSHLLFNYAVQELPLYTLPILQEGLAVAIGGRWGKSRGVILDLGGVLNQAGFIWPDSIITRRQFYNDGPADITYPISGLIVMTILEKYGVGKFTEFYLAMSGNVEMVESIDHFSFKKRFAEIFGIDWNDFLNNLKDNDISDRNSLICQWQTDFKADNAEIIYDSPEGELFIYINNDKYYFDLKYPENSKAILLTSLEIIDSKYMSTMFAQQLPGEEYGKQRYGILVNKAEIGIYDYFQDELIAKSIVEMYPDSEFSDPNGSRFRFVLDKGLFDHHLESFNIKIIKY